jgi:hypothetical protein
MTLDLVQHWLPKLEDDFRPGTATFSWEKGRLRLEADFIDEEVGSTATANQQKMWEHGDVIELFYQRKGRNDYHEYQISPNGFTLALHYPDYASAVAVRKGERQLEEFFITAPLEAEAILTSHGWRGMIVAPLEGTAGDTVKVSCSRYDYGTGRPPVLSSTSLHSAREFHRASEWREFVLRENAG